MREIKSTFNARLEFSSTITLNESEIRALDALVGYGDDGFLKLFYEKLGRAYMKPHEDGLRSFMATVRREVLPCLSQINEARRDLNEAARKRDEQLRARIASSRKLAEKKALKGSGKIKKIKKIKKVRKKAA